MFGLEQKYIDIVKNILQKYLKDQKVYVFGSRSVGNFIKISNEFKDSSLPIDVDVVLIKDLSSEFLDVVKKDFIKFEYK